MTKTPVLLAVLVLLVSAPAFAALSPALQEWGKGPVQWIMTKEEQRAWSAVGSDQEASDFIDLFWARRDPSPGTEANEFKEQFEGRMRATDKAFAAGKKRGSMTDPGRVFIVLGPPKEATTAAGTSHLNSGAGDPDASFFAGGNQGSPLGKGVVSRLSGKSVFTYEQYIALGLAKPEIVFTEDEFSHEFKIDPQQGNPYGAMATQVAKAIVNKDLTAAPQWALHGGLESGRKKVVVTKFVPGKSITPAPAQAVVTGDPGASRLTLLKDVTVSVKPQSGGDPLAVESQQSFSRSDELGYAFQLCRSSASDDTVHVTMKVSGIIGTHAVNLSAPPEEMMPERIKASSSCYVVRAAIPLAEFEPGAYRLEILVDDGGKTYNLGQEFKVE